MALVRSSYLRFQNMKTDIHLLWIDDNKDFVEGKKPRLTDWLNDQGFGFDVHYQKSAAGAVQMLKNEDIALVVLDYHLGKKNGDTIIQEFRGEGLYQDIVFYSQDFGSKTFEHMDGVFKAIRDDVEVRIKRLLELRIRSSSDFATFRGWFLADSIELEIIVGRIITKLFGKHGDQFKERVLDQDHWLDFAKKHQLLNGLIKDRVAQLNAAKDAAAVAMSGCRTTLSKFVDDIIHPRNGLAHQPSELHEGGKKIKTRAKGDNAQITDDPKTLNKLRRAIRTHHQNLIELERLVGE